MRSIGILLSFVLLMCLTVPAQSGHSSGNGSCTDELIHYQNFEAKRSDAPLFAESQQWRDKAVEMRVTGNTTKCEEYLLEAIRMLKKVGGEYPTE
tara:strand:- start:798 stop:1082 length:285 start_codon:yes stop_codon:yes gene_type:complete